MYSLRPPCVRPLITKDVSSLGNPAPSSLGSQLTATLFFCHGVKHLCWWKNQKREINLRNEKYIKLHKMHKNMPDQYWLKQTKQMT